MGDPGILCIVVEILNVRIIDPRLESRLPRKPVKECFDQPQGCVNCGHAERFARALVFGSREICLEFSGLFNVKLFERFEFCAFLETQDRSDGLVQRLLVLASGLFEIGLIFSLCPLVFFNIVPHGFASFPK